MGPKGALDFAELHCPTADLQQTARGLRLRVAVSVGSGECVRLFGSQAFINVTAEVLRRRYITLLPKDFIVVEILENVSPEPEVLEACKELKQAGYQLALDDYVDDKTQEPFLNLVDIVKVDFLATNDAQRQGLARRFSRRGTRLVAEKLETPESFKQALELGYDYFQGYFFKVPVIIRRNRVPGHKFYYLQLLAEIHRSGFDIDKLEAIIKDDVSLTYRLLRLINSAFFGLPEKVRSVRHALLLLGEREIRKWASLVTLTQIAEHKARELLVQALVRARFCEALAEETGLAHRSEELFLMGMLSLMDVILCRPLGEITESVPVDEDIKQSLNGESGLLYWILECARAYEEGDWSKLSMQVEHLGLLESRVLEIYREVMLWTQHDSRGLGYAA
jgi:EAL and modified HD-GYP domain-containing signal transduction protein